MFEISDNDEEGDQEKEEADGEGEEEGEEEGAERDAVEEEGAFDEATGEDQIDSSKYCLCLAAPCDGLAEAYAWCLLLC